MTNWTVLNNAIRQVIYSNGTRDITGQILQTALLNIVNNVGSLPAFGGTATPSTNPGVHDGPVFYIATAEGMYANFNNIAITKSEVPSVLIRTDGTWTKQVIGTAFAADIEALVTSLSTETSRARAKEQELEEAIRETETDITDSTQYVLNMYRHASQPAWISSATIKTAKIPVIKGLLIKSNSTISNYDIVGYVLIHSSSTEATALQSDTNVRVLSKAQVNAGYTVTAEDISNGANYLLIPYRYSGSSAQEDFYIKRSVSKIDAVASEVNTAIRRINSVESSITSINTEINSLSQDVYITSSDNLTSLFEGGYIATVVGQPMPEVTANGSRAHLTIMDVSGKTFVFHGEGGTSGALWAKYLNGVCIAKDGDKGLEKTVTIESDGTFDALVFNTAKNITYSLIVSSHVTPKQYVDEELSKVRSYDYSSKKLLVLGDSAVTASSWAQRLAVNLGFESYRIYAAGGFTIRNQYSDGALTKCLGKLISTFETDNPAYIPDYIILQMGGNDLSGDMIGTAEEAFNTDNYLTLAQATTTYPCLRYYTEYLKRKYPSSLFLVGTVFQRQGSRTGESAKAVNDVIRDTARRMCLQLVNGEEYCGFSSFTEPCTPYYNDGNPGVANDRTNLSRNNPIYNYIEDATGDVVNYETATSAGTLLPGYSKRYGLYTYDGKHQNLAGEDKVVKFWSNALVSLSQV